MASWSARRKFGYFMGFFLAIALFGGVPAFLALYEAPTCSDGKQNGSERGVDCGGACARLCAADYSAPRVLWSYSTRIVPGVYNAMAYVQNPNPSVEAVDMGYSFKLYDAQGLLVAQKDGRTYVPAGQRFVVFEGGIRTGERVPTRTTFEFLGQPEWRPGTAFSGLRLLSADIFEGSSPRAEARIQNETVDRSFSSVDAYIVIYDEKDNRMAFSKTLVESIAPGERQTLYFTWPEAFSSKPIRSEVLFVSRPR